MEQAYKYGSAALGAAASFLYGGWSGLLTTLLVLAALDYASGVTAAFFEKKLSSTTGGKGIAKKFMMFAIIAVAHMVDNALGNANNMLMHAALFFYIANELVSLLENAGRLGVPLPPVLSNAVEILKGKSDNKGA